MWMFLDWWFWAPMTVKLTFTALWSWAATSGRKRLAAQSKRYFFSFLTWVSLFLCLDSIDVWPHSALSRKIWLNVSPVTPEVWSHFNTIELSSVLYWWKSCSNCHVYYRHHIRLVCWWLMVIWWWIGSCNDWLHPSFMLSLPPYCICWSWNIACISRTESSTSRGQWNIMTLKTLFKGSFIHQIILWTK